MSMQAPLQGKEGPAIDRRVLGALETLLAELSKAIRAVSFYPLGHPLLAQIHKVSFDYLGKALAYLGEMEFEVGRQNLTYQEHILGPESEVVQAFRQQLFKRRMKKLILQPGATFEEFEAFTKVLALDAEEIYMRGGVDTILIDAGVGHIWADQIDYERLRRAAEGEDQEAEPEPELPPPPPPQIDVQQIFLDSLSLDEADKHALTPEEQQLQKVLPILAKTADPEKYYEGMLLLAGLAERFIRDHKWEPLFTIVQTLEKHSTDPVRGVEFKKYSYRALRKITTPEVIRALLTELTAEKRTADEIESILGIVSILGAPATDLVITRLGFVKDDYSRNLLEQALYHVGPEAAPRLYPLLGSDSPELIRLALRVLGRYKVPEAVERIAHLAEHADAEVQAERVRALLRIRTAAALDQLTDVLMGDQQELRETIVKAYGYSQEVRAGEVLLNLVRSQKEFSVTPALRSLVFSALGQIGGPEIASGLLEFLGEKRLWRHKHDEESLDEALGALAEAASAPELATLRDIEFKSDVLKLGQEAAVRRIEERLQAEPLAEDSLP